MKNDIIKLYKEGLSAYQIMTKLNITSKFKVYKILKEAKLTRDYEMCRHPSSKLDLFKIIDSEEKAYWLGFLFADGCVYSKKGRVNLGLHIKDVPVLERWKTFLGVSNKINFRKTQPLAILYVTSKELVKDLKTYGLVDNKSLILQPPINLPEEYVMDFIRGLFDGDGSISRRKELNRFTFELAGTYDICEWVNSKLREDLSINEHNGIYRVMTSSKDKVFNIYNKLYKNASIFLPRKKKIFDEMCAVYDRKIIDNNSVISEEAETLIPRYVGRLREAA